MGLARRLILAYALVRAAPTLVSSLRAALLRYLRSRRGAALESVPKLNGIGSGPRRLSCQRFSCPVAHRRRMPTRLDACLRSDSSYMRMSKRFGKITARLRTLRDSPLSCGRSSVGEMNWFGSQKRLLHGTIICTRQGKNAPSVANQNPVDLHCRLVAIFRAAHEHVFLLDGPSVIPRDNVHGFRGHNPASFYCSRQPPPSDGDCAALFCRFQTSYRFIIYLLALPRLRGLIARLPSHALSK